MGPRKYEQLSVPELAAFVEKVARLKAEGMTVTDIATRIGVHRNTVNERLRMFRAANALVNVPAPHAGSAGFDPPAAHHAGEATW